MSPGGTLPFGIRTERLVLDQPLPGDVDDIARYCVDPLSEEYLSIPWPYRREHAVGFVAEFVPKGWLRGEEWTWAIRASAGGPLLGVIGVRMPSGMVGFWLGAPHRGRGILPEALSAVIDEVFARTDLERMRWECVVGNAPSMRVAAKAGFRYTGEQDGMIRARDGAVTRAWTAELLRGADRTEQPGWPSAD